MDYVKPNDVVATMVSAGISKAGLGIGDILIRGALSGAILESPPASRWALRYRLARKSWAP